MNINWVINIIGTALAVFGIFLAFQAGIGLLNDRRKQQPSDGSQWWLLVEGALFAVFGGALASILAPILSSR